MKTKRDKELNDFLNFLDDVVPGIRNLKEAKITIEANSERNNIAVKGSYISLETLATSLIADVLNMFDKEDRLDIIKLAMMSMNDDEIGGLRKDDGTQTKKK